MAVIRTILALCALATLGNAPALGQVADVMTATSDQPIIGDPRILVLAAQESNPELDKILAEMDSTLLRPGPAEPDWEKAGIDLMSVFIASPEGLDGNLLHGDPESPTIRYFGKGEVSMPSNLTEATIYAVDRPLGMREFDVTIVRLANNVWMRMEVATRRRGNARCTIANLGASLFSDSAKNFDQKDIIAGTTAAKVLLKMRDFRPCVLTFATDGGYRERTFLPDGRTLPYLDKENDVYEIAPLMRAPQLLMETPKPDAAPASP